MKTIQEYDLDINHDRLVKGQGLCKLVEESQDIIDDKGWDNESSTHVYISV
jgi:hypothetical protein